MLEVEIQKLTAALEANTAALFKSGTVTTIAAASTTSAEPTAAEKKKAAAEAEKKRLADAAASAGPTLQDVREVAQKLVDMGRKPALKEVNIKLGVAKISELPPEKLGEAKKLLEAAIAAEDESGV